jgi:hypothetical protein
MIKARLPTNGNRACDLLLLSVAPTGFEPAYRLERARPAAPPPGGRERHALSGMVGCPMQCTQTHGVRNYGVWILRRRWSWDDLDVDDVPVLERQQVARQRQASGTAALLQSAGTAFPVH